MLGTQTIPCLESQTYRVVLRPHLHKTTCYNQTTGKGGKKKSSQNFQAGPQALLSTSGTNHQSAFQSRNCRTGRPHFNIQLVVNTTISGKTVSITISAPDVDPDHMLHICAIHHSTQVATLFVLLWQLTAYLR